MESDLQAPLFFDVRACAFATRANSLKSQEQEPTLNELVLPEVVVILRVLISVREQDCRGIM